jgi:hypothetical protein
VRPPSSFVPLGCVNPAPSYAVQADWLELERLSNFAAERCWFPDAPLTHVYTATAKTQKLDTRFFLRTIVIRKPAVTEAETLEALTTFGVSELVTSFNTLEGAIGDSRYPRSETNHIFFRLLAPVCLRAEKLKATIAALLPAFDARIKAMHVYELEIALPLWEPDGTDHKPKQYRVICRLAPSIKITTYEEVETVDQLGTTTTELRAVASTADEPAAEGQLMLEPYRLLSIVDQKRLKCQKLATTYAYDYVHSFELAVAAAWALAPTECGTPPRDKVWAS